MAYLEGTIILKVYTDTNQTEFPQELVPSIQKEWEDTTTSEVQTTSISLAASATQAISFNGLDSITGCYIYSSVTDLSVTFNGGSALTYAATVPGFMPITVTSLSITNASSSFATVVTVVLIKG